MIAGLAFRNDHPIDKIISVEDLKNTVIGFQVDAIIPPVMRVDFIKWKWNYKPNWKEQNFALVIRKRIDAAFDAMSVSLEYEAIQLGVADQLKILHVAGTKLKIYTAFPKSGEAYFLKKYNAAHNKLREEVNYDDIVKKYMVRVNSLNVKNSTHVQ
jgi:ABC-type amino acid transport substrate-binding protein